MIRQFASVPRIRTMQRLFEGFGLNMQLTTDQALTKLFTGTNYIITDIVAVRASGAFSTACAGGIYNATSKPAGGILVAAAQSWANLTGTGKIVIPTLAALVGTDIQNASIIYVSLTTGNAAALTADFYVNGYVIS